MRQLTVVSGTKPNAYVLPLRDEIFITDAGNTEWSREQLKGVLAHENAHADNKHAEAMMVLNIILTLYALERLFRGKGWKGKWLYPHIFQLVAQNTLSYATERVADREAKKQGLGENLASALSIIDEPLKDKIVAILAGKYHPNIEGRIERLTS